MSISITTEKPSFEALRTLEDELFGNPSIPGTTPLAFSSEFLQKLLTEPQIILVSAVDENKRPVGYAAGGPALGITLGLKEQEITPLDAFYLMTLGVLDEFRNQGIGQQLITTRKHIAQTQGYTVGAGHFREGASAHLARKNLSVTHEFPCINYGKTGETFHYIVGTL